MRQTAEEPPLEAHPWDYRIWSVRESVVRAGAVHRVPALADHRSAGCPAEPQTRSAADLAVRIPAVAEAPAARMAVVAETMTTQEQLPARSLNSILDCLDCLIPERRPQPRSCSDLAQQSA